MKKVFVLLQVALIFLSITMVSCSKDNDDDPRDKFVGVYSLKDSWTEGGKNYTLDYSLTITKSSTNQEGILMSNFAGYSNVVVSANIAGNTLTIPQQTVKANGETNGFIGSGSINGTLLNLSYNQNGDGFTVSVSTSGYKQ